ncbi:MAG: GH116 family glycosyl hydrolase [Nitrososphaera sp.]
MQKTREHSLQGLNPGGYYQAIWCRDAAYILRDWSLSGNMAAALQQLNLIWLHQIEPGREKIIYGRGSPEMQFLSEEAKDDKQEEFAGALPTTIYQIGFTEVYAQNPDIDSTALMISTTSKILRRGLEEDSGSKGPLTTPIVASESSADYVFSLEQKLGITDCVRAAEFLVPKMMRAVDYLLTRDRDGDGLLEQNHNEDWMDTVLRTGKIVYSQACWIMALRSLARLLDKMQRRREAERLLEISRKAIGGVEKYLWSEEDGCYIDIQESHHLGAAYRTLTQDVALYLVAITDGTARDNIDGQNLQDKAPPDQAGRAQRALDAMKNRLWDGKWPLVTEVDLKISGPWVLQPHQYHNHTFWPWSTGIEMLARSRFDRVAECDELLSTLATESHLHMLSFYEWVDPTTGAGNGAFPFRTGICAVRVAIADIYSSIRGQIQSPEMPD